MSAAPVPRPKAWPRTEAIPLELRERARWVCWRWATDRSGRPTKTPCSARTGALCDITSPSSWSTYDAAVDAMARPGVDGVGIVLTEDDSLSGGDIDNCRDSSTGDIQPWAMEVISGIDTYTEVTPSGSGVRFFAHAKLPLGSRCSTVWQSGKVELYSRTRYLTLTGNHLAGTPLTVNHRQTEWEALYSRLFGDHEARQAAHLRPCESLDLNDEQLLQTIRRSSQGSKFERLNAGDLGDHGGDHSSADLAFCNLLAFWTRRDPVRMDRFFRHSGLMRPKWDSRRGESTYGAQTIERAIAQTDQVYSPPTQKAPKRLVQLPPATTPRSSETPPPDLNGFPLTDVGNAERFVLLHRKHVRYCHPWKAFLVWDGKRWVLDATAEVTRRAKMTTRRMFTEGASVTDSDFRDKLLKHARDTEKHARLNAMISLAAAEEGIPVLPEHLDADPMLLTVGNGTLDLRSGRLVDFDPHHLITKLSPVHYNPDADCPTWMAFQRRIMSGNEDLIRFKQRAIGYALTGLATEKRSFYIYQGLGNNGKTTELEVLRDVLGEYAGQVRIESLMEQRNRDGNAASPDIADLRGLRFVISSEPSEGARFAEATIKYLTGMGTIKARHLHKENFEFRQTWKFFMDCNHKPVIRGTDNAIWNRIGLVPFDVVIPDEEIDRDLPRRLREELPGILSWAVQGCLDWQKEGLGLPDSVRDATSGYRSEMDVIGRFIEECCVVGDFATSRGKDLYKTYSKWCDESGETAVNVMTFGFRLAERGFSKTHDRQGVRYSGIGFRTEGM